MNVSFAQAINDQPSALPATNKEAANQSVDKPAGLPTPPSKLYFDVIKRWAEITEFAENTAELTTDRVINLLTQLTEIDQATKAKLKLDLKQFFYEIFVSEETMKALAGIYAQFFTIDDIFAMNEFYASPVGQKLIKSRREINDMAQNLANQILKAREKDYLDILVKYLPDKIKLKKQ